MKLVLGSSSRYRQHILQEMGYDFDVVKPNIDEKSIRRSDPEELVIALAQAKADAVLGKIDQPAIIITSDQVGTCNSEILEKPESADEVRRYYQLYAKYPLTTVTAVMAVNSVTGVRKSGIDIISTYLKPIPASVIDQLIDDGEILQCAGAIRLEDPLIAPYIRKMDGTIDSAMGLPKSLTRNLIAEIS